MKITDIKTYLYHAGIANWQFVKIETDEGIHGWGEACLDGYDLASVAAVETMKEYFLGKDPRNIELHWDTIYRESVYRPDYIIMSALSGIEQASWDILGKSLNVPVYQLLGGAFRTKILAYGNGWTRGARTPEDTAEAALKAVAQGYKYLKWDPFGGTTALFPQPAEIKKAAERIRAVREAVGDDIQLLIEAHGRFSPDKAIEVAHEIEEYKPYFYEEPVPPDNIGALVRVARSIKIPVATGERICTHWGALEILEKSGAAILQPDIVHIGGILETKKLAIMAQTYYIPVAPHNAYGPVQTAANLHIDASIPNFLIQEFFYNDLTAYNEILKEPFPYAKDGYFDLPTKPGLGVDIDEKALAKRPYQYTNIGRRIFSIE
jgi:galactonate dehydratase